MKVKLDSTWTVETDEFNFVLYKPYQTKDKEGNVIEGKHSKKYYSTIKGVLNCYKDTCVKDSDVQSIDELLKLIKKIDKNIASIKKKMEA